MKDILHLKNIYYSKKCGFMFPYDTKDVELYIKKYKTEKKIIYNSVIESPLIVIDTIHSCFVHGIIDSIFPLHWMIQDIKEDDYTKKNFKIFVREDDILNYSEQNMKHIDEEKSVYKGVYGELMNICTQKDILFEHLIKEDTVYLIKDCYFSKLETKNQRSVWNNVKYYPNRCEEKPIFGDKLIQRRLNLFSKDVLNYYGLEKNDSTFKKRIIIVDRNTKYRSFKHTIVNPKDPNENANSLLDILNNILLKSTWMNYNNIVYLEDLSMKEQMEIFLNNDIIITPHGANMVHSLWCNNKIIVEVLFEPEKKCMYKRMVHFTNNKLAQVSPYQIDQFLKMLLMRFKPKQEDTIEISCVS